MGPKDPGPLGGGRGGGAAGRYNILVETATPRPGQGSGMSPGVLSSGHFTYEGAFPGSASLA